MAPLSRGFLDALAAAVANLERCGVTYMLTGGIAVQAWGTPRLTFDADIEASFRDDAQRACFERGLILEEEGTDILGQPTRIYNAGTNPVYIEVFLASHPFVHRALARRRKVAVPDLLKEPAWLIGPEDLLVMKALHATHESRSPAKAAQDRLDITAILQAAGPRLDLPLVAREAATLGLHGSPETWATGP